MRAPRRRKRKPLAQLPEAMIEKLTPEMRTWQEQQLANQRCALEADLQQRCEEILRMRGLWFLHLSDPSTRYNHKGIPDLLICAGGKFLAVELKTETGTVSGAQHAHIERIKEAGGMAYVCRSVERFIEILDSLEVTNDRNN